MSDIAADPVDALRTGLLDAIVNDLGPALVGSHLQVGDDLWIRVTRDSWVETFTYLKTKHGCTWFDFLSAIDWLPSPFGRSMDSEVDNVIAGRASVAVTGPSGGSPSYQTGTAGGETRFQMLARVYNIDRHFGITVKADLPDDDVSIATLIPVFPGANWHEREAWEMFGISFAGHPDQRHLYVPTDFEGNPRRKDFPLIARMVKPWPGIVDVEQMPGESAEEGGEE